MKKEDFLLELNNRLAGNPDKDEIVSYYYELLSDRVDAGELEDMVFTQAELDEIMGALAKESAGVPIVSTMSKSEEEKKETTNVPMVEEENDASKELSGGRKFWYTIWRIATVCFCIAAVATEIACVGIIVGGWVMIGFSAPAFKQSVGFGIMFIGTGLIIIGAGIVGGFYAKVLHKYMFSHRIPWNKAIYEKLGGRR